MGGDSRVEVSFIVCHYCHLQPLILEQQTSSGGLCKQIQNSH